MKTEQLLIQHIDIQKGVEIDGILVYQRWHQHRFSGLVRTEPEVRDAASWGPQFSEDHLMTIRKKLN